VLYDMPIGMAEPHYAQIIKADKLKPFEVYPEIGWNPETMSVDPNAITAPDQAKVVRDGANVEIWSAVIRSHYTPEQVEVNQGDHVVWHLTSLETARDATHGFALSGYNINLSLEPGETQTIEFDAAQSGTFTYYCTEFCSALHLEMIGYFLVMSAGEVSGSEGFRRLEARGAALQRPLWASTSTKDPSYPDLYYVEALVAPDSVDTMPPETFEAYRDHGDPKVRISDDLEGARETFRRLAELGIDDAAVSRELEEEGVRKFSDSYDALLKAIAEKAKAMRVA